jgi:Xaa-Pro aminopeptidase
VQNSRWEWGTIESYAPPGRDAGGWAFRVCGPQIHGIPNPVAVSRPHSFARWGLRALRTAVLSATLAPALTAQIPNAEFTARRNALSRTVGDGVLLVLGALEPVPDYLPWEQSRPFYYLTGFREPNAALVIVRRGSQVTGMMFVPPNDPSREVWNGARLGVARVRERYGMEGRDGGTLMRVLDSLLTDNVPLHVVGDFSGGAMARSAHSQMLDAIRRTYPQRTITDVTAAVNTMRGVKSESEFHRLRIATEISARGHLAAIRLATPGVAEFELQAAAEHAWRSEGADGPGYLSILGSGPNSTVLHYNANSRVAESGDLVVMDMAAQYDGYSSDITRTIPVNGKFSPAQRDIYEIVLAAQMAAERQVRPGSPAQRMLDSANAALAAGLTRVGLIESPSATYDCAAGARPRQCPQLSLFYMHGLGHGIGLEVHDPDQYYETGTIGVGSAFTIEPGIYIRAHLASILPDTPRNRALRETIAPALARYGGIGVRIEDDYLVTTKGVERPSALVPREIDALERLLAEPRIPRNPSVTSRYLRDRTGR